MFSNFFSSISRGFGFVKQSVAMASADGDLIKPSLMMVGVSMLITLVMIVPIVLAQVLIPGDIGSAVAYVLGAVLIFVQYVVSYLFSGLTIALIHGYVTKGDGQLNEAGDTVKRNIGGIIALAAVSTVVKLIENAARNRKNPLGSLIAGILEAVWTTATYFILPAMIIENLSLVPAIKRSAMIIKNNFLLVGVSYVGVGFVVGLLSLATILLGVALALGLGAAFAALHPAAGIVVFFMVLGTFIALLSAATSYVNTAYYTCLFLWARDVETARERGVNPQQVPAPAPLAAVLA